MPATDAVVREAQRRILAVRSQLGSQVDALWSRLGGVDDASLLRWLDSVVPLVEGAQLNVAALVDGYLAAYLDVAPVGIDPSLVTGAGARNGATLAEVYSRPVVTMRTALANGVRYADALTLARQRAVSTAQTDVMLAQRATVAEVIPLHPEIVGYRRVLTGASCMFCATASTQRYKVAELMPLHAHCDCTVAPITGRRDPGRVLNGQVLDRLRAQGPEYWKQRGFVDPDGNPMDPTSKLDRAPVQVEQHGELGPVLTDKRHEHATEDDVKPTRVEVGGRKVDPEGLVA